jgi:hypothetical protein
VYVVSAFWKAEIATLSGLLEEGWGDEGTLGGSLESLEVGEISSLSMKSAVATDGCPDAEAIAEDEDI